MTSKIPRLRIVAFNDVYELANLPRLQSFLSSLSPSADAVLLAGDFLSPSTLSALDGGKGMVATLRAVGVTHVSLGNHEADLRLNKLKRRLDELGKSATILNTNILPCDKAPWLRASSNSSIMDNSSKNSLFEYSILSTKCKRARVKLVGLMSDEPNMFRDNTFRGAEIENVIDAWDRVYNYQNDSAIPENNLPVVALTHQTIHRDKELARHMVNYGNSLIIGGHEHEPFDIIVEDDQDSPQHQIRILKSGMDASACHAIDIEFDNDTQQIASIDAKLELLSSYEPSIVVQKIVDQHQSLLTVMENEVIIHAQNLLPPGVLLSSVGTRYRQTTVGAVLCTAIKEQLEVDVAMINGAPIKGNRDYPDGKMSFAELKKELPFPTKMVVVTMKRWQLHEAIHYSRKHPPEPEDRDSQTPFERRGYLQVDVEFDRLGFHTGGQDDILKVALPRNLMKGFCDIEPLVHFGSALKAKGEFPVEDDHVQAMDLVINHFCREAWYEIVRDNLTFDDLDIDHKGFLTRDDVARMLTKAIGHEPAPFVIDHMIAAVDADENGVVDRGEFSFLLAQMEREHGMVLLRFD